MYIVQILQNTFVRTLIPQTITIREWTSKFTNKFRILTCTCRHRPGASALANHLLCDASIRVPQSALDGDARACRSREAGDQALVRVVVGEVIGKQLGRWIRAQRTRRERAHGRRAGATHHWRARENRESGYDNMKTHTAGDLAIRPARGCNHQVEE